MSNYVNMMDIIYPVGSIYVSMNSISPAETIGGTWMQITDKFLRPSDTSKLDVGGNHTHNFKFVYASFYGLFPTLYNANPDASMFSFEPNEVSTSKTSTYIHNISGCVTQTWGTASKPTIITKIVTTSEDSQIPSSITCYCWYRTA